MRKLSGLALIATLLSAITISAVPQSSFTMDQVFAKLDDKAKMFEAVEANIDRTKVTVVVDDRDNASGKFYYVKAKDPRVKLELTKPDNQVVLVDKGKLQIYTPRIKQVQEASTVGREGTVELFLALGFGQTSSDLKKAFDVSILPDEAIDGVKRTVLDLKPKNSSMFKSVRMWLDQKAWHAVQIKTVEKSNDYLVVKFTNVKINPGIPDSRFKLNLPKDVTIIKL